MNRVRLATEAECMSIKDRADLDPSCVVYALDTRRGTAVAVRRLAVELDPIIAPDDWDTKMRSLFWRDLEHVLWSQGALSYYFNIHADDEAWNGVVKTWGAEQVSTAPEFRYKKAL